MYLSKNVVHGIASSAIVVAENAKETEQLDLKKRIGDARNIMVGREAAHDEVLEETHQLRDQAADGEKQKKKKG